MNTTVIPTLRAVVWKETKENAKWAVLALAGIGLALVFTIAHQMGGSYANSFKAVWDSVGLVMTFGAPVVGLAFGLLQILPELRRDQWAFLVHRPAARSTLFWGKAIAGISLTLLSTFIPLLGLAVWVQAPGHIPAPFDPRLLLGGLAAILTGLAFYVAGLLTALRPARWYGSRALPVPMTIVCAVLVGYSQEFLQAVVIAGIFLTVLLIAARGSFLTTGSYQWQPRAAKFCLGLTLFVGLVTILIAAIAVVVSTISTLFPPPQSHYTSTDYEITRSGQILRVTYTDGTAAEATDLSGHNVVLPKPDRQYNWGYFLQESSLSDTSGRLDNRTYNDPMRYVVLLGTNGYLTEGTEWYYVPGRRQIVSYSLHDHDLLGALGPNGLAASDSRTASQFVGPLLWMAPGNATMTRILLTFPHAVYLLNTDVQGVIPVLTSEPRIHDFSGIHNGYNFDDSNSRSVYAIAAGERFTFFSPEGRRLFTVSREYDRQTYPGVTVAMTPDRKRFFFYYSPRWRGATRPVLPTPVTETTADGKVLQKVVLPPIPRSATPSPSLTPALFGLLSPPVVTGIVSDIGFLDRHSEGDSIWFMITDEPILWRLLCAFSAVSGLISALLAWRIGRRCVFRRGGQWGWTVGAFWLGLPGVLLLLSLRDWPAREACPHCGRLRVVDRDRCEHCGAEFPPPVRDGTEIFDDEEGVRALAVH